jgi:ParB-like chromosome segregation protein Spo0J
VAVADKRWSGPESLRKLLVPIASLKQHPRNPRRGDVKAIVESLMRFGQLKPVAFQEGTKHIVAGNHTQLAAIEMNWTHIAATGAEMTDDEALAFLIADNRTADRGGYDTEALSSALKDLRKNGKIAGTGYTPEELKEELGKLEDIVKRAKTDPAPTAVVAPLMRQLGLSYDPDRLAELHTYIKIVQRERGLQDAAAVVFDVVRDAARSANE